MRVRGVLLVLCLAALSGCAGAQYRLPQLIDAEVDHAALTVAAKPSDMEVRSRTADESRILIDRAANRLRHVAPEMCKHADVASCFFYVVYVDDELVNATATDGQHIQVYRGLLQYLDTEEEVAAVIGHEMGHHIAEHLEETRRNAAIGAAIAGILTAGTMAATGYQSPYYDPYEAQRTMGETMKLGASIGAISFSKEQEREADLLGAYLLERAGYDLYKAGRLYEVLATMDDRSRASWFDTHPAGAERIAGWRRAVMEVKASTDLLPNE